ncbi:hypothetical protein CEXT_651151 [Caerostris extrusa]|uniref:Uncharacterized protein n=1 Tax=Caerostris extrusa TaxID=172846 RepID=A0AAV4Y930_CAEEX|nr:hypothetical protein CEXT_651151 [Caerostris extrusa]
MKFNANKTKTRIRYKEVEEEEKRIFSKYRNNRATEKKKGKKCGPESHNIRDYGRRKPPLEVANYLLKEYVSSSPSAAFFQYFH